MRRYIRARAGGGTFFFTVTLKDRRSSALVARVDVLRVCVARVRELRPFRIDAMVVLPEHLHAVWTLPPDDEDYSVRWQLMKRFFTRAVGASIWQDRYWEHQVRDADDLRRHVDYIHFNPVKHGWVERAGDWPHSSFHRYVRAGRLPADWGRSAAITGRQPGSPTSSSLPHP